MEASDDGKASTVEPEGKLAPSEIERSRKVEQMDKARLRFRTTAVVEHSAEMLKVPVHIGRLEGVSIAGEAPEVEFVVVPLDPRFFPEPPAPDMGVGLWSSWGQGTYRASTGKFYAAVGNHLFHDARIHIVEYDAKARTVKTLPEVNQFLGRKPGSNGDGKIHGTLDFYNGRMYFCTFWCQYPEPTEEQYGTGYDGGKLVSFDPATGEFKDLGVPVRRTSWPYHRMDKTRGLMYGNGQFNDFMCYGINKHKLLFAGFPPQGMVWFERSLIVDEATGCCYSSNVSSSDPDVHILQYDSRKNKFHKMKSCVPKNCVTGETAQMRAHTSHRSKDGWFLCISRNGEMFKFYPDEDRVEDLGLCWSADPKRLYTTSIAISPNEKYVYYIPGAHGGSHILGTPVVHYNTITGERKALAFLCPYFYEKYGYVTGGTFSVEIDDKGERLFVLMNGAFNDFNPDGGDVFGDPAVMVIHIPASERT